MKKLLCVLFIAVLVITNVNLAPLFDNVVHAATVTTSDGFVFDTTTKTITGYVGSSENIVFPAYINGVAVKKIGSKVFENDKSLPKSITISNGIEVLEDEAFWNCYLLTKVSIPASVCDISYSAFRACYWLTDIVVSSNNKYYTVVYDTLYNKSMTVLIKSGGTNYGETFFIPNSVTEVAPYAFERTGGYDKVIGNNVTTIGEYSFAGIRSGLEEVVLPNINNVPDYTFISSEVIKEFTIPYGVTSIGNQAFCYCYNLKKIVIPETVSNFGNLAIYDCHDDLIIYGVKGSAAESYASANGIEFSTIAPQGSHAVSFNWNYTTTQAPPDNIIVKNGNYAKNPLNYSPQRYGYKFIGWYSNKSCDGEPYFHLIDGKSIERVYEDIVLYAGWSELDNKEIIFGEDTFNWENTFGSFTPNPNSFLGLNNYKISGDFRDVLLDEFGFFTHVSKSEIKSKMRGEWGGSCAGMSCVLVLMKNGDLHADFFQEKASNINDFSKPKSNKTIFNLINYYQLSQFSSEIDNHFCKLANKNNNEALSELVGVIQESPIPVLIVLQFEGINKSGAHAVLAYDVTETTDGYDIKIWDPNDMNDWRTVRVYENPFYVEILDVNHNNNSEIVVYTDYNNITFRGYIDNADDYFVNIEKAIKDRGRENAYSTSSSSGYSTAADENPTINITTNYPSFTLTNAQGQSAVVNGLEWTGDLEIAYAYPNNEIDQDEEYVYVLENLSDYTITQVEETGLTSYETMVYYDHSTDGFASYVEADNYGQIVCSSNGQIATQYSSSTNQTVSSTRNDSTTPWYTTDVVGVETGLTVSNANGSVTLTALDNNLDGTVVTTEDDYNELEVTLTTSEGGAAVTYDEASKELVVSTLDMATEIASAPIAYSVNFNTYGGSIVEAQVNISDGSQIAQPTQPTMEGCIFGGWYKDADCTDGQEWNFSADTINGNMALHAKWTIDEDYLKSLTFKSAADEDVIILIEEGGSITTVPDVPPKDGYDAEWEDFTQSNIMQDQVINAVYTKYTDFNGDSTTDMLDVILMCQNYNSFIFKYDLNDDGVVNLFDLVMIAGHITDN